jgi:hypothetical protein
MTLPQHGLARYRRVRLEVTRGVLCWRETRALLGVVPAGVRRGEVPIGEVESTGWRKAVHPVRTVVGVACVVVPWFLTPWWAALPLTPFGLWVMLVSLGPHLEVVTGKGASHRIAVCLSHSMDADLFLDGVGALAAEAARGD